MVRPARGLVYNLLYPSRESFVSTNLSDRDKEIASVFSRALPLIDLTLRREFRLPKQHATEVEQDVYLWFRRFSMRPASGGAIESLRPHLFWATCKAARDYWAWRLDGAPVVDTQIRRALMRDPEEVAKELEERLRKKEKRSKPEEKDQEPDA